MTDRTEAGAGRPEPRRIDWRHAAALLASGMELATVARRLGCSRSQLSRKRHHDAAFQRLIEDSRPMAPMCERDRIEHLRVVVGRAIEAQVEIGNVRVLLWLADRLKLITPPSERMPNEDLREILGGLSSDELREFESLRDAP